MDDLASLEETLEIVSQPEIVAQIRSSLDDIAAGRSEVLSKDDMIADLRS